jgi:SNF2 family DNA or RNA helicase
VQRQGYDYVRLDGSTPQKQRQGICDEFNSRPSIFLLLMSTVAGGLGLNLTAANKVVSASLPGGGMGEMGRPVRQESS